MSAASGISQCWSILPVRQNSILELRAIWPNGVPTTKPPAKFLHFRSEDFANAATVKAAFESAAGRLNREGYNVYTPLNEIAQVPERGVKDADISKVRFILIDVDRAGDTSCPANEEEICEAVTLAKSIKAFLHGHSWPEPIAMLSGNGAHLLYPVDTDDVAETSRAIKRFLRHLADKFNNDHVHVDKSVFNPARIWKLPGTVARKGQETEDRFYREAKIFSAPKPAPVTLAMLNEVIASLNKQKEDAATLISYEATTENDVEVRRLKSALAFISPDVPRGKGKIIDEDGIADAYWAGVVWAIAGLGWASSESIARSWSKQSKRYSDEGFKAVWEAYNPKHDNPVGIGSVFDLAKMFGWHSSPFEVADMSMGFDKPETADKPETEEKSARYSLSGRDDLMALPPLEWVVKGILPSRGLAAIYGPSGSGKTFLILDLAAAICTGDDWFGFRTKQTPVVYLGLEGGAGLQKRVKAWELAKKTTFPASFRYLTSDFDLTKGLDVEGLIAAVPAKSICIIDTLNRASPGSDENASADMGKLLAAVKKLEAENEGLVILCHHTGKDRSQGLRGHSSLHAAMDAEIELRRNEKLDTRSWRSSKVKDEKDGTGYGFRLVQHRLGFDADGDPETSCTVEREVFLKQKSTPKGSAKKPAYDAITSLISQSSITGKANAPFTARCIKVDDAMLAVSKELVTTPKNKRSNRARTLIDSLAADNFLRRGTDAKEEGWIWLPDE